MTKLSHSDQDTAPDDGGLNLPFDGDGGMYFDWFDDQWGDYDTPEENDRARGIVRKMEGCAND